MPLGHKEKNRKSEKRLDRPFPGREPTVQGFAVVASDRRGRILSSSPLRKGSHITVRDW